MARRESRWSVLPVGGGPRLESYDAHSKVTKLSSRHVRPQRCHDSLRDLVARRRGGRTAALSEDRPCYLALAEPAGKINFPDSLTETTEDAGSGRVGKPVANPAPAKCHEDEEQRPSGTLGPPPLNSEEMPESRLVVGLTSRSALELGVAGKGFGHHGYPVAVLANR